MLRVPTSGGHKKKEILLTWAHVSERSSQVDCDTRSTSVLRRYDTATSGTPAEHLAGAFPVIPTGQRAQG